MIRILNFKNWQIFLLLILLILIGYLKDNISFSSTTDNLLKLVIYILTITVFFSYPLMVGMSLNSIKENPHHFNKYVFIFAFVCCIAGYSQLQFEILFPDTLELNFALDFVFPLLTFFGILYLYGNVAKSLKSLESGLKANLKFYVLDSILFFASPIGVWFIQPRLKKIKTVLEMIENEKTNVKH